MDVSKVTQASDEWKIPDNCVDSQELPEQGVAVSHDVPPKVMKRIEPEYPRLAMAAGLEGTVVVSALVDRCGQVRDAIVATASEIGGFNESAVHAVRQWRFRPARNEGVPVAIWTDISIEFKLPRP